MRWPRIFFALSAAVLAIAAAMAAIAQGTAPAPLDPATPQHSPAAQFTGTPQLVILDTDIGDDIDDAFALALALRSPEIHLLGITTEYGDTELRARLVDRYLTAVGRTDIPVAAGVHTPHKSEYTQAEYALQQPARRHANAVDFLLAQIRAHPGQITLIAIGPLFNVGAAIERDPATFRELKRVVMMGGSVYRGYDDPATGAHRPPDREWNIYCDPAGAKALLASGVPVFMMPLDSTQIHFGPPQLNTLLAHGSALTAQLALLYGEWSKATRRQVPTLFDPVTVAYIVRPSLCPMAPLRLSVEDGGFTRPVAGAPDAEVCLESHEAEFRALLLGRIAGTTAP